MAVFSILASASTVPHQINIGVTTKIIIDKSLDLITVCVPPALPAAMSCGIVFAINRLKKSQIFCISPPRVNMAGQITHFVFDKTGTLTAEGLEVLGFKPTSKLAEKGEKGENTVFSEFIEKASELVSQKGAWWNGDNSAEIRDQNGTLMTECLASCTAITYVEGKLVGDPLDVRMFESTNWIYDESEPLEASQTNGDSLVIANVYPQE